MAYTKDFDVIIIGGSYAGLSAAMALGRSLRNTLIIDSGLPCNRQTPQSHNFLTQDGKTPHEISMLAKQQVEKYDTVKFYKGFAITGKKIVNGFEIITDSNDKFTAKKLILATGVKDIMPDIKGFAECWGISIIHCPYCHGYEYRKGNTAILANGEKAFHMASLVNNLTDNITILTAGKAEFNSEQIDKLNKHNIKIIETEISEFENKNGQIQNVVFTDSTKMTFNAAYAVIPFLQPSDIPVVLECELNKQGYIKIDAFQKTTVEGIYACGDNTNMMRSIANAVYSGNITGAVVNGDLTNEQF
ncbi:MAG TPA: NAD(P)/FAD-dependent oxidoreductase [Chitinophagaceae bacterium]|nr:NAD(P)/FAD-dependent oxidoreductase [Chitinophagaceae bacterium]